MVIATRILKLRDDAASEIPVRIFAPVESGRYWECYFEIGWPQGLQRKYAAGLDAVQALDHALKLVGTLLYNSDLHESGRLMWDQPGSGYGFPAPSSVRDDPVGDEVRLP
jgi:hypothetical protein